MRLAGPTVKVNQTASAGTKGSAALRLDLAEATRLVLRKAHDLARLVGELLEHTVLTPPPGSRADLRVGDRQLGRPCFDGCACTPMMCLRNLQAMERAKLLRAWVRYAQSVWYTRRQSRNRRMPRRTPGICAFWHEDAWTVGERLEYTFSGRKAQQRIMAVHHGTQVDRDTVCLALRMGHNLQTIARPVVTPGRD